MFANKGKCPLQFAAASFTDLLNCCGWGEWWGESSNKNATIILKYNAENINNRATLRVVYLLQKSCFAKLPWARGFRSQRLIWYTGFFCWEFFSAKGGSPGSIMGLMIVYHCPKSFLYIVPANRW